LTEVSLAMIHRDTSNKENPNGGPMWVVERNLIGKSPIIVFFGKLIAGIFCTALILNTITAGNMFQAWNVANLTQSYFGVPTVVTGCILAILVGAVIIGGIKRIGAVASKLVPFMLILYVLACVFVLSVNLGQIPSMLALIVTSAFEPLEASNAFIGGTAGYAFMYGMQRALFSNEAGQGSSAIAHSAAKTDEPIREGVVAGLEPFIDTIVVCTMSALVILVTGIWKLILIKPHLPKPQKIYGHWRAMDLQWIHCKMAKECFLCMKVILILKLVTNCKKFMERFCKLMA
jgi:AGCS family alanine or glycine:cation symporter